MASPTRRLLGIWLPTALGASMLVLEIPVVYAGAARSSAGPQILAAMGICVAILVVVNSPALAITPLVVAAHDRHHARRLWRHSLLTGLAGALTLVALATVPPLIALVRLAFDADEVLLDHVRAGLVGLAPNALGVALRRYLHGRLIIAGRTRAIATATGARLAGTFALAWGGIALLPQHGALVAGLALSAGAFSESAGLALAVRRLPRPPARGQGRYGELLRRHAEISTTRLLNMVPMVITTVGVAHSAQAAASLMVWPAIYELTMLFASPTSDWEAVVATALRQDRRDGTPRRLTIWLAGAFASAFVIVLATGRPHSICEICWWCRSIRRAWLWTGRHCWCPCPRCGWYAATCGASSWPAPWPVGWSAPALPTPPHSSSPSWCSPAPRYRASPWRAWLSWRHDGRSRRYRLRGGAFTSLQLGGLTGLLSPYAAPLTDINRS
nr:hypothetical protein GCM10020093_011060 [Planobispora longispora]